MESSKNITKHVPDDLFPAMFMLAGRGGVCSFWFTLSATLPYPSTTPL